MIYVFGGSYKSPPLLCVCVCVCVFSSSKKREEVSYWIQEKLNLSYTFLTLENSYDKDRAFMEGFDSYDSIYAHLEHTCPLLFQIVSKLRGYFPQNIYMLTPLF